MRKAVIVLSAMVALAGAATSASAEQRYYDERTGALLGTGAVVGTVVGVGLFNGWWGSSATATALGSTAASSAVVGGVAGVGTVALIHAATTPCTGFDALLGPFRQGPSGCVDGHYVGYQAAAQTKRRH
ncbi:hypothetical protein [Blastochloris sulfoviridis]|uniref:17 kDa surface antigen n=1 Tax=Blastochloris sulfoviridis TaxID=50712 RepID=A0A5M6I6Y0_9HYPH|nr:hypothetical protein [Blastochloris sulfoviridis]KAA5603568.1 hypothetical protein F1193_00295 [Blastochloris sulfoviridis]